MRRVTLIIIVVAVVGIGTVGATFAHLTVGNGTQPPPAQLPQLAVAAGNAPGPAPVDGVWNLVADPDSFVGYRVREQLASFDVPNDAVGRTSQLSGSLTVAGTQVTATQVVANLSALASDNPNRDQAIQESGLESNQFPEATFALAQPIELGGPPAVGQVITAQALGNLTLHGVTQPATLDLEARWTGDTIEVAGSAPVRLSDFAIEAPVLGPVVSIQDDATIELQVTFRR